MPDKKKKILIVDDTQLNREILLVVFSDEYDIQEAKDGNEAVAILGKNAMDFCAVFLDIVMPGLDGYGVLNFMKENGILSYLPVLVLSSDISFEAEKRCLEMGVSDFIHRPFDSDLVKARVRNIVELYSYKKNLEDEIRLQSAKLYARKLELEKMNASLALMNDNLVNNLGEIVEFRSLESSEHVKRVKTFTKILAEKAASLFPELRLTPNLISQIVTAAALHDVGKIAVRDAVLLKPGKLTKEEFEHMKTHTTQGAAIIDKFEGVWNEEFKKICREICLYHHEKYDGKGYPKGLKGAQIPVPAQLVSVADVYDALTSERCYKKAFSHEKACEMIVNGDCGMFSPWLMECFKNVKAEFEHTSRQLRGTDVEESSVPKV